MSVRVDFLFPLLLAAPPLAELLVLDDGVQVVFFVKLVHCSAHTFSLALFLLHLDCQCVSYKGISRNVNPPAAVCSNLLC